MKVSLLNERQLDALREFSNIGMGHAATALAQLTGRPIHLHVPRVRLVDTAGMASHLGGADRTIVGIHLRMLGRVQGNMLMVLPLENAGKILEKLLPHTKTEQDELGELQCSALKEVGNILASAYLSALGDLLKMILIPSVPILSIDSAATVVEHALADFGEVGGMTLLLETEFFSSDERINSQFFLLPAPSSLEAILSALGITGNDQGADQGTA